MSGFCEGKSITMKSPSTRLPFKPSPGPGERKSLNQETNTPSKCTRNNSFLIELCQVEDGKPPGISHPRIIPLAPAWAQDPIHSPLSLQHIDNIIFNIVAPSDETPASLRMKT